ncbi:hypothetical protein CW736_00445 [Nonlabens sp. MB-3u-79]|uniref:hypothetical protein n=1 Tax=Nonlabens sp. MB-3u-79 TaxID=2058134 RepID=UPI000C30E1B5|nr:hypothetical protein [Nonlabens sp. MB-3u-79]AUC77970.1 hypothetical protein CW736_00445 [Nonlabens sp. MB-3u-79]
MTRAEHLTFCEKCTHRKKDFQQGILCGLTDRKADFEVSCNDFIKNETVPQTVNLDKDGTVNLHRLSAATNEKLREEQNLAGGIFAGIGIGVVGAVIWAVITVVTEYQIAFMAIGIGFIVGHAVRLGGKGVDMIFGIIGATIAILSCFLGNFLSTIGFIANYNEIGYLDAFLNFDYSLFIPMMKETFGFMDVLFYGFAGYEGFKLAFRVITNEEDITKLEEGSYNNP